jgi:hypothetical protein
MSEPTLEEALAAWEVPEPPIRFADRVLAEAGLRNAKPAKRRDLRARLGRPPIEASTSVPSLPPPPILVAGKHASVQQTLDDTIEETAPILAAIEEVGRPSTIPLDIDGAPTATELRPWRVAMTAAAAALLAVGLGLGFLGGSTRENRVIYDRTLRDVRAVHSTLDEAGHTVEEAQRYLRLIRDGVGGQRGSGAGPTVDYESIDALARLERPFDTAQFTSRSYTALPTSVVQDLFEYVIHVRDVWERIGRLVASSRGALRSALDRGGVAVPEDTVGAVLVRTEEGGVVGALAFLRVGADGEFQARASRESRSIHVERYEAGPLGTDARYVIPIDASQSRGVLSERRDSFARFAELVRELEVLLAETLELQGRLLRALGEVASLEEL